MFLKPEGVEQSYTETLFLELTSVNPNNATSISFSFPPDVVPGSQRAHVALVGTSTICCPAASSECSLFLLLANLQMCNKRPDYSLHV